VVAFDKIIGELSTTLDSDELLLLYTAHSLDFCIPGGGPDQPSAESSLP
jgi:hypothetical protein